MSGGDVIGLSASEANVSFFDSFSPSYHFNKARQIVEKDILRPAIFYIRYATPYLKNLAHLITAVVLGLLVALSVYSPRLGISLLFGGGITHLTRKLKEHWENLKTIKQFKDVVLSRPAEPPSWECLGEKIRGMQGTGEIDEYFMKRRLPGELPKLFASNANCFCQSSLQPALYPVVVNGKVYDAEMAWDYKCKFNRFPWETAKSATDSPIKLVIDPWRYYLLGLQIEHLMDHMYIYPAIDRIYDFVRVIIPFVGE